MKAATTSTSSQPNSSKKGRGRPKKQSNDTGANHQRARVRRAQNAFRQRKEAHLNAVEAKCLELELVVEQMTNEFVGFSDRLLASKTLAEETMRDVQNILSRFLILSKRAAREIDEPPDETSGQENQRSSEVRGGGMDGWLPPRTQASAVSPISTFTEPVSDIFALATTPDQKTVMKLTRGLAQRATFDPYTNTIWSPRVEKNTDTSIIPYILSGRDSFASRLYFETINLAVRSLQGDAPWEFAANMFRFKLQYVPRDKLFDVLAGVLEMLLLGVNEIRQGRLPQRALENDGAVQAGIVGEIVVQGGNESDYLSALEVEQYLKDKWSLGLDSKGVRLQRGLEPELHPSNSSSVSHSKSERLDRKLVPFAPTIVPGFSRNDQVIVNAEDLLDSLKIMAVTIGAGPRWHFSSIDGAVVTFLERNSVRISEIEG